jgi:hypothetical protein
MSEQTSCCPGSEVEEVQLSQEEINQQSELDFLTNKEKYSQERLDICKQCPNLVGPLNNCKICACFMNVKVRIYSASCPIGNW